MGCRGGSGNINVTSLAVRLLRLFGVFLLEILLLVPSSFAEFSLESTQGAKIRSSKSRANDATVIVMMWYGAIEKRFVAGGRINEVEGGSYQALPLSAVVNTEVKMFSHHCACSPRFQRSAAHIHDFRTTFDTRLNVTAHVILAP